MGLDQSWYLVPTKEEKTEALLKNEKVKQKEEIAYYRKWHDLNEFLGDFYPMHDYNCQDLYMTDEILDQMYDWSLEQDPADEHKLREEVIPKIQELLDQDRDVYYCPWW